MPTRAFVDSNVFIFGFERPRSNSRNILELLAEGDLKGVVTDRVVLEVMKYFRRYHGKDLAARFRDFILFTCELVLETDLRISQGFVNLVGRKDAGAVAATKALGLAFLVSTDSDFKPVPQHRTPRGFLMELDKVPFPGDE